MRKIPVIILVAIFVSFGWVKGSALPFSSGVSQAKDSRQTIQQHSAAINRKAATYKKVKRDLSGFSTEGGELAAYFRGKAIMKMVATYYGETGRTSEEYYYWDEKLISVLRQEYTYDKPLSGKVIRTKKNSFYFSSDKLISWVNEKGKEVDSGTEEYQAHQEEYLQSSRQLTEAARAPKTRAETP